MNYEIIKKEISEEIKLIVEKNFEINVDFVEVEQPNNIENGHFSSNVALKINKQLGIPPRDVASKIIENIKSNKLISKVEIAGPGFINYFLSDQFFKEFVLSISNNINDIYIKVEKPESYNLEFVSANPTGDLHLGHARGAAYGDAVARLLLKQGHKVVKEYYINDAGSQMDNLGLSVLHFYKIICDEKSELPEGGYGGKEIKEVAQKIFDEYGNSKLEENMEWFREIAYDRNLKEIKRILEQLNIPYDVWSSERFYHETKLVDKNLEILDKSGDIYIEDGATWLNTTKYGDDKDRVIRKKDGDLTYFAADIAYHIDKFNRGNKLINVWGGDHHGYMKRVKCAMESLGHNQEDVQILLIQMINIIQGDKIVKMSKRAGTSVTIKEMLKEIDPEAIRYFFVMRSPDTQLDFDLDLAKTQSSENPVFYIQYAHARISTLIETAKEKGIVINKDIQNLNSKEIELINLLAKYPVVLNEAANKRLPHMMCNYLYELASNYHQYYNANKVFTDNVDEISDKINIGMSIQKVLSEGLDLIGITAKNKM